MGIIFYFYFPSTQRSQDIFFDWKEGLAKDQGIRDVLAAYVPEDALKHSKTGGLVPALGKAFALLGSLIYSKTESGGEQILSIRPNEAAFVLRGNRVEGLYYEGNGPHIESSLKGAGFKFLATASSVAAYGLYLTETITMPAAAGLSFGAWLSALIPVLSTGDCRLLLVETTPFELDLEIGHDPQKPLITKDGEFARGSIYSLMKIRVDRVEKLIDLLGSRNYLTKSDVQQGLSRDFIHRTLTPHVSTLESTELRTNPEVHQAIETFARSGVAEYFDRFGVDLERLTIGWDLTESEKRERKVKEVALSQAGKDLQAKIDQKDRERETQARKDAQKLESESRKETLEIKIDEAIDIANQESSLKKHLIETRSKEDKLGHELKLEASKRFAEMVAAESEVEKVRLQKEIELSGFKHEKAALDTDATIALEDKKHEAEQKRRYRDAEVKTNITAMEDEQDLKKLEQLKKIEREDYLTLKKTEAEIEMEKIKFSQDMEFKQKELEAQARLKEMELKSKLSADQIMALSASESDAAAQAMAEKFKSESQKSEDMLRKMSEMMQGQMNTVNQMALNYGAQMADVARAATGGRAESTRVCGKCNTPMDAHWKVCPNCG